MDVLRSVAEVPPEPRGRAVAVGTFDGVHLGHRQVIESALGWGREQGCRTTVVTFDPHPLLVLQPEDPPRLLTSIDVKADLIAETGVDELLIIPFTDEFSRIEAEQFCDDVLVGALGARYVSVGQNFHFGHAARGDAALLESRPEFETAVVPLLQKARGPVSSSRIRELLGEGNVSEARELLGAPFRLEGVVVRGDERGRKLGMPTANVAATPGLLVPAPGIYAGAALGRPAAISIGVRPTFEQDGEIVVEAHLIDFQGDLYGTTLRLFFLERIRDEVRFDSADALAEEMERDVERALQICASERL